MTGRHDRLCAGFRTPAGLISAHAPLTGVRKAPRHEIASRGSGKAVSLNGSSNSKRRLTGYSGRRRPVVTTGAPRERGCPPWVVLGVKALEAPGVRAA